MAKIIGIRPSKFTGNDGTEVSGKSFYMSYKLDKGDGDGCERVFLTDKKLADMGRAFKVGDEVNIEYNRYGKCSALIPLK